MKKKINIKLIADFMKQERNNGTPFSFLVGAGCSKTAGIPLASELIKEIHECGRYAVSLSRIPDESKNDYGAVMAVLDPKERQTLLGPYLHQSKVNWGHIAMACMMDAGFISRTLTFNFDNVLARACGMSSLYPATYDFVSGVTDRMSHITSPSIIHLHGQGHGLAMLNSKHETEQHALKLRPLLNDTLQKYSMLVIGYSGASDEVFPILRESALTGNRIFWIAHDDMPAIHVRELIDDKKELGEFHGGADSDTFLIELANELECFPPSIINSPIKHARKEISVIAEYPVKDTKGVYKLDLLSAVREFLDEMDNKITDQDYEKISVPVRLMQNIASEEDAKNTNLDKDLRSAILFEIGKKTHKIACKTAISNQSEAIDLFKKASSIFEEAVTLSPDFKNAWNNIGVSQYELAHITQNEEDFRLAVDTYQKTAKKFPQYARVIQNSGSAMLGLALLTKEQKHFDKSLELYKEALQLTPYNTYDIACYYAIAGNYEYAKKYLEICILHETSPDKNHIKLDSDLDSLRQLPWFDETISKIN